MKKELLHFVEWKKIPEEKVESTLAEVAAWICSATVLFHKVKAQVCILTKRETRLLGECKIGVVKSVMFGISNLIFHCKYPFFKMVSFGINYQGYLLRRCSGVMPTTAD